MQAADEGFISDEELAERWPHGEPPDWVDQILVGAFGPLASRYSLCRYPNASGWRIQRVVQYAPGCRPIPGSPFPLQED